jgi:hypothetical protein
MLEEIKLFLEDLVHYFVALFHHFSGHNDHIITRDEKYFTTEDNNSLVEPPK